MPKAGVTVNFTLTKGTAALSAGSGTTNGSGLATIAAQITNQNSDVQVSACVAPNNSPCQIFTLFSTPASLWTLETVSGSPQVVPAGQLFQPLLMRVTDGSSASNPVMGVNITFQTTLARVSEDGMPIVLGSSLAEFVSTQDGLASIVPSVGSVGPCDVFITVSAGHSTAQVQMESVAAIVPAQVQDNGAKGGTARRGRYLDSRMDSPAPQAVPDLLFAVPEGILLEDSAASQRPCSDACQDPASGTGPNSGMSGTAAGSDTASPCEPAPGLPKVKAPQAPAEPPEAQSPQGLKPASYMAPGGTAEAVPFQSNLCSTVSSSTGPPSH